MENTEYRLDADLGTAEDEQRGLAWLEQVKAKSKIEKLPDSDLVAELMMLYQVSEPLIYDCIRYKEETDNLISNIQEQLYIIHKILHPVIKVKAEIPKEENPEELKTQLEEYFGKVLNK